VNNLEGAEDMFEGLAVSNSVFVIRDDVTVITGRGHCVFSQRESMLKDSLCENDK